MSTQDILKSLTQRVEYLEKEIISIKKQIQSISKESTSSDSAQVIRPILDTPTKSESIKIEEKKKIDFEVLLGGNIIGKLGLIAILVASGWFIKFAFDNQWINESGRIIIGLLIGYFFILWGGFLANRKMKIIPEPMIGTGVSILFVSIYGGYFYYDFFSINEAFLIFCIISFSTAILAGKVKSEILYIFAMIGSILTPMLLSTGENSYRFLFIYLTILNLVFLYVSKENSWKVAPYLLAISNFAIYSVWAATKLEASNKYIALIFLLALYLIFSYREIHLMTSLRKRISKSSLILFSIFTLYYLSYSLNAVYLINKDLLGHFTLLVVLILIGILFYFDSITLSSFTEYLNSKTLRAVLVFLIFTLMLSSLILYLEDKLLSASLIVFASLISFTGIQFRNKVYIFSSLIIWIIALLRLYLIESHYEEHRFAILNYRFALFFLTSISLIMIYRIQKNSEIHPFMQGFAYASFFTLILGSLIEVRYFVSELSFRRLCYSYVLALYTAIFLFLGFRFSLVSFRRAGVLLASILILKFYAYDIWRMSIVIRIIAGFSLGIGLVLFSMLYQKYKDKINMNQILKLIILFSFLNLPFSVNTIYAQNFNPNTFKYKTKVTTSKNFSEESGYGKFKLTEEISKFHGMSDLRLVYNNTLVPYFISNAEESSGKSGETKPKVIFDKVKNNSRVYVLKLEEINPKSEYYELELSSESNYESSVSISFGNNPDTWVETFTANVFKYSNEEADGSKIQFLPGNYRYIRLNFDTTNSFNFTSANYRPIKNFAEYKTTLDLKNLSLSNDSDKKATVYYYENSDHKPIDRILIDFEDSKYDRAIEIYERKNSTKEFVSIANTFIIRKDSKEPHSIYLNHYESGKLKILIANKDDAPLKLKSIELYTQIYEISFEIPKNFSKSEELTLYYGNTYANPPEFDLKYTIDLNTIKYIPFTVDKHGENQTYSLTMFDPPNSIWLIRIIFFLGFALLLFPIYKILKKYKEELSI